VAFSAFWWYCRDNFRNEYSAMTDIGNV
jgi:hypothetical protein